jgi:hypothetical protein
MSSCLSSATDPDTCVRLQAIGSITRHPLQKRYGSFLPCLYCVLTCTGVGDEMQALHDVVQAGYVRYIGMSSCWAWQCKSVRVSQNEAHYEALPVQAMQGAYLETRHPTNLFIPILQITRFVITSPHLSLCKITTILSIARRNGRCSQHSRHVRLRHGQFVQLTTFSSTYDSISVLARFLGPHLPVDS